MLRAFLQYESSCLLLLHALGCHDLCTRRRKLKEGSMGSLLCAFPDFLVMTTFTVFFRSLNAAV